MTMMMEIFQWELPLAQRQRSHLMHFITLLKRRMNSICSKDWIAAFVGHSLICFMKMCMSFLGIKSFKKRKTILNNWWICKTYFLFFFHTFSSVLFLQVTSQLKRNPSLSIFFFFFFFKATFVYDMHLFIHSASFLFFSNSLHLYFFQAILFFFFFQIGFVRYLSNIFSFLSLLETKK